MSHAAQNREAASSTATSGPKIGRQYEGLIQPGNIDVQVPLPEGSWRLAGWDYYTNDQELGGVLIQTEGTQVSRMIEFYVPYITLGNPGYLRLPPYRFCGRKDIIYVGTSYTGTSYNFAKGAAPQDCWGIDHWPTTFYGTLPEHILQLRDHVEANGLKMPETMITVEYRRGVSKTRYVSLSYYFNPELEGFSPPREVDWRTSDWHRDRMYRDPKKKAYIEKLKAWGASWKEQVEAGLHGSL